MSKTGITLLTAATPNGQKVSIALEELGLPYTVRAINLGANEQKEPEFLKLNPNGRIPAIVDHDNGDLAVWESGSILLYLAERYGKGRLVPTDDKGRADVISWLMWQMSGQGPMQGQANFFTHAFPTKQPATIERFVKETDRLYSVLEAQLSKHAFVAGDAYSIADIACVTWAMAAPMAGIDTLKYPHVRKWVAAMRARPAVIKGLNTPETTMKERKERLEAAAEDDAKLKELVDEVHAKQALVE